MFPTFILIRSYNNRSNFDDKIMTVNKIKRCKINSSLNYKRSKVRQLGGQHYQNERQIVISRRPFAPGNPLGRWGSSD